MEMKRQGCLSYGIWQRKLKRIKYSQPADTLIIRRFCLVVVLLAFGVMMVYSASAYGRHFPGFPADIFAMRQGYDRVGRNRRNDVDILF